jgi:hypothetical protein
MNFRSPELLRAVHELPCQVNIIGICEGGNGEPAHSNQQKHGKGMSIKAHDCFVAAACRKCHAELDHGKRLSRKDRFEYWEEGFHRTILELFRRGLVKVAE